MKTDSIDKQALYLYLSYRHVPTPMSIRVKERRAHQSICPPRFSQKCSASPAEIIDTMDYLLWGIISQVIRDMPQVAVLLSGGVDSGIVTAIASKVSRRPVQTFCLTYTEETPGTRMDREYARLISEIYETKHTEFPIDYREFPPALEICLREMRQPFSGYITPWFIGRALSGKVASVLTGDWGDELFGSYKAHRLAAERPEESIAQLRYETLVFSDEEKEKLLTPKALVGVTVSTLQHLAGYGHSALEAYDIVNQMLEAEFRSFYPDHTYLAFATFTRMWRLSTIAPMSFPSFADYAASIPGDQKIRDGESKYIERVLAERYLPKEIAHRPKQGFTTPTMALCLALEKWIRETLAPEQLRFHGLFNEEYVEALVSNFFQKPTEPESYKVWNLVCFQTFFEKCDIG